MISKSVYMEKIKRPIIDPQGTATGWKINRVDWKETQGERIKALW